MPSVTEREPESLPYEPGGQQGEPRAGRRQGPRADSGTRGSVFSRTVLWSGSPVENPEIISGLSVWEVGVRGRLIFHCIISYTARYFFSLCKESALKFKQTITLAAMWSLDWKRQKGFGLGPATETQTAHLIYFLLFPSFLTHRSWILCLSNDLVF